MGRLRTRCKVGSAGFEALPRKAGPDVNSDPELADGMLTLRSQLRNNAGKRYQLNQIDIDGAAMKTLQFVEELNRIPAAQRALAPPEPPPGFRSVGLSVARADRGGAVNSGSPASET